MTVLDQNKNGIRDYIEPEIVRIANGSERDKLILEQYARSIDGTIDHLDDSKTIQVQAEKMFKFSGCAVSLKIDSNLVKELTAIMNDSREHSVGYFRVFSASIDEMNKKGVQGISIKDCEFDTTNFVGKK